MKHDLTTGTWQDDTGCPISFVLAATSDDRTACGGERKISSQDREGGGQ